MFPPRVMVDIVAPFLQMSHRLGSFSIYRAVAQKSSPQTAHFIPNRWNSFHPGGLTIRCGPGSQSGGFFSLQAPILKRLRRAR
jgi:hypothetical protein